MGEFFKSLKFKIILCLIALFAGIMLYSVTRGGNIIAGSQIFSTAFEPIWKITSSVSNKFEEAFEKYNDINRVYNENQQLKSEISNLNKQLVDYQKAKTKLEELQKFVGIKEENLDLVLSPPCSIIAHTANDPYGSFTIDKGSNDKIELYDPVVTADGLVGVITQIASSYSVVTTILSPDISIGAISSKSKDTGIIEGSAKYFKDGYCKMIYIDKDNNNLKNDDMIVTSGEGGLFPRDYLIGKVKSTGIEESGLSTYAVIEPFVDFSRLTDVIVITNFDGKGGYNED